MQFCLTKKEASMALDALRGVVENLPEDATILSMQVDDQTSNIHLYHGLKDAVDLVGAEISVEEWPVSEVFDTYASFTASGVKVFKLAKQSETDAILGGRNSLQ